MTHRSLAAVLLALGTFGTAPSAEAQSTEVPRPSDAYPTPAVVSASWNLDFEAGEPQSIMVPDAAGRNRWYWFLPYRVTNNSGADQTFIPEVTVYTDQGDILAAGQRVPSNVYAAIARRMGNDLLQSPVEVVGRLLQGEDYAKESVAIWPAFEGEDVDRFTVFIGGLSGETTTVANPSTGEEVLVRRTRAIDYAVPGNYPTPQGQPVEKVRERDVMR